MTQKSITPAFILNVTVYVRTSDVEKFMNSGREVLERVSAEPECIYFFIGKLIPMPAVLGDDPNKLPEDLTAISWTEGWSKDINWFMEQQMTKAYYHPYLEETEKMFVRPREMQFIEPFAGSGRMKA